MKITAIKQRVNAELLTLYILFAYNIKYKEKYNESNINFWFS